MEKKELEELRREIDKINLELLELLSRRTEIALDIAHIKAEKGLHTFDPQREAEILEKLIEKNRGPFGNEVIKKLFKQILQATMILMNEELREELLVSRRSKVENTIIRLGDLEIGGGIPQIMAGPCAVESEEQMDAIAAHLAEKGVRILRGGAFKPRTSPYSFQGLRKRGLEIMKKAACKHGLFIITEVMDPRHIDLVGQFTDIFQIGARNMHNYELLKELGQVKQPIFLKRGFMSTIEECLYSAEYIFSRGNPNIILCERGIRTFEPWTRNTLDIAAIPIIKQESHLPVFVDLSHALGRTDIILPMAKAVLAAGADGLMLEVHCQPSVALSDGNQQMNLDQFDKLLEEIEPFMR